MKLHYRVQNVPGREGALTRLLPLLPPAVEVITDHAGGIPNPLRGYLLCLEDPPPEATHLVIVQDDALPCRDFDARVKEAVEEKPDDLISLFVGGLRGRTLTNFYAAQKMGKRWTTIYFREIHHVVALVWPVAEAAAFLRWFETARIPGAKPPRSDDAAVGYWARTTRRTFWARVPCLVEHPDDFPSTIRSQPRFGDKGRRAISFIDG